MILASLIAFAPLLATPTFQGDGWPHLRGPGLDGATESPALDGAGDLGFAPLWRASLGSSYSGVAVADGRVVTLYSDGAVDAVVALNAEDGVRLWRTPVGPTYLGHDGSEDGAISSPVVGAGSVFVIGPRGRLLALGLEDGQERWSVDLVGDLGATLPDYGFGTTPLLEDGVLVVQAGGSEGRAVCGLDAETGELRWSLGEGEAGYASPVAMELAGRRQVVVLAGAAILGIDAAAGEVLWSHGLGERVSASSGVATPIDGERFCAYVRGGLTTIGVAATPEGFATETLYTTRELGSSYAAPVAHEGYLYGYKSNFLTCVDADTGKRVWKSRPPGGNGLIRIGERLAVFGAEGVLALVRATPEGYGEETRLRVLERSSYTWPGFANGRVYLRNTEELVCVELAPGATTGPQASAAPENSDHLLAGLERTAAAAGDKRAAVDAFLAEHERSPVFEGDLVHFVYRGEVEDVAIVGGMTGGARAEALRRIEGTDLYHATYEIEPGARWDYQFQIDFDARIADPRNPLQSPAPWGEEPMSEVVTDGYAREVHYLEAAGSQGGRVEPVDYTSATLGNQRAVSVYLPPGYDGSEERYPLLIVHEGPDSIERGGMVQSLDNLIGERVRPVVVAFVPPIQRWWFEAGGTGSQEYVRALGEELVPLLEERYRLSPNARDRALMGRRGYGMTVVYGALRHPDVFGKAAVQGLLLNDVLRHELFELLESAPKAELEFYLDWDRYGALDADSLTDARGDSRRMVAALEARGYSVAGGEALDSHGWGAWRARTDDLLEALFPMP